MRRPKLRPGDSAPEFFLRTSAGEEMSLATSLLEGPLLVEFLRGTWDPDSRRRIAELHGARESFRSRGAGVVAIACERPRSIAHFLAGRPGSVPILSDEDRSAARAYGVLQRFTLPIPNVARPSSFLVDRCGFVRHAYAARLQIHAAPLGDILALLDEIRRAESRQARP
jgi:peroxiredoxin